MSQVVRETASKPAESKPSGQDVTSLRDLSPEQWKSGAAAWLGWLFDGLDMHLYTLVALPFVTELMVGSSKQEVSEKASIIQAGFLVGWALGGGFFGRLGDRLGRSRALILTILTYAIFTGMSYFAQTWWQLLIFRFLAALGIGGEWAVGASLLSETWPRTWRPWVAAMLQTGVNIGILFATLAASINTSLGFQNRAVFLVGIVPALLTLWIRKAVPEPEEWHAARAESGHTAPPIRDLFRGSVLPTTVLTILMCALALTGHWAFTFWNLQNFRKLPDVQSWTPEQMNVFISKALAVLMTASIVGNFFAAFLAQKLGYRKALVALCLLYFGSMMYTYGTERSYQEQIYCLWGMGIASGMFALFTMYLPPLFPTLLRTTGAGFCYNIGRVAAAAGTVYFGLVAAVDDYRLSLLYAGFLFLPAAAVAIFLPEPPDERSEVAPVE